MKRKRLTIFFFSAMILAVTPRAMHHFQNYVAAAQTQAQTELLHLLLSFGAPAAESQPAQQNTQPQLACTTPVENRTQPAPAVKPRSAAPASNAVAQNMTFEFTIPGAKLTTSELAKQAAKIDALNSDEVEARQVFVKASSRLVAVAPYLSRVAKSEYLKSLLRDGKLDDKKALCDVQRELLALTRASGRAAPLVPMRLAQEPVAPPIAQPEPPRQETGNSKHAGQDAMR